SFRRVSLLERKHVLHLHAEKRGRIHSRIPSIFDHVDRNSSVITLCFWGGDAQLFKDETTRATSLIQRKAVTRPFRGGMELMRKVIVLSFLTLDGVVQQDP